MQAVTHFRTQAQGCAALGSPMYADLIERLADDLGAGGLTADLIRDHADSPGPAALALRLVGGLHRLVLTGGAAELAPFYPSVGGTWAGERAWPVIHRALAEHSTVLRQGLVLPPQTNEVGRSVALMAGLLWLRDRFDLPVRLFEIGSSAGLNLLADAFDFVDVHGRSFGPGTGEVRITDAWQGWSPTASSIVLSSALGCDIAPVAVASTSDRLRLLSYVWPDMPARLERTRGALAIAARRQPVVREQAAGEFVTGIAPQPGSLTVLWHSVMWQYLDADEQDVITDHVDHVGAAAGSGAPLAYLRLEPSRRSPGAAHEFLVRLDLWAEDYDSMVLGTARPHGPTLSWEH